MIAEGSIMNELKIFNNDEFGQVRTIVIDNEPWFLGKDICTVFGDKNHNRSLGRVDDIDKREERILDSLGRKQAAIFINESGLYALLFSMQPQKSNHDGVTDAYPIEVQNRIDRLHKFKHWVTSEVLPSIRKHGIYATDKVIDDILNNPDFGIELLTKLKEERAARVEAERRNAILTHVNKTYTMTEIAKELNMKSAVQLNKLLAEKKIQYQVNNTWVFYSQYSDLGYEEIKQEILDSGKVIYHRRITQIGREFILNLFRSKVA